MTSMSGSVIMGNASQPIINFFPINLFEAKLRMDEDKAKLMSSSNL